MLNKGNIFAALAVAGDEEQVTLLAEQSGLRIERIVSHGHCSAADDWYDQDEDEWVLLLAGAANLQFADDLRIVPLSAGDHLFIPAHDRHRVDWTDPDQPTIWLTVFFSAKPTTR